MCVYHVVFLYFFNDTATTEIYTYGPALALHAALPICHQHALGAGAAARLVAGAVDQRLQRRAAPHVQRAYTLRRVELVPGDAQQVHAEDRKSTRLNSSH